MPSEILEKLCDFATEAHTRIQTDFSSLDPIVGVSQNMRKSGIPADAMTIDCLRSGKRIIIVLHDQEPGLLSYQFAYREKDPLSEFQQLAVDDLTVQIIYEWICGYFLAKN